MELPVDPGVSRSRSVSVFGGGSRSGAVAWFEVSGVEPERGLEYSNGSVFFLRERETGAHWSVAGFGPPMVVN